MVNGQRVGLGNKGTDDHDALIGHIGGLTVVGVSIAGIPVTPVPFEVVAGDVIRFLRGHQIRNILTGLIAAAIDLFRFTAKSVLLVEGNGILLRHADSPNRHRADQQIRRDGDDARDGIVFHLVRNWSNTIVGIHFNRIWHLIALGRRQLCVVVLVRGLDRIIVISSNFIQRIAGLHVGQLILDPGNDDDLHILRLGHRGYGIHNDRIRIIDRGLNANRYGIHGGNQRIRKNRGIICIQQICGITL